MSFWADTKTHVLVQRVGRLFGRFVENSDRPVALVVKGPASVIGPVDVHFFYLHLFPSLEDH